ncbi:venom peptide Pc [Orussus abietinus]|uniref:venom peptide Pc n=1 Tax=Orussus abietinus TaxID=222816 RepID=UPI0006263A02|nr:venom peptide Pc [Orussus abietinus]
MRSLAILCALALLVCLFTNAEAACNVGGKMVPPGVHIDKCIRYTCHEGGHLSAVPCALATCENLLGYTETDLSKPYPDCCPRPICGN